MSSFLDYLKECSDCYYIYNRDFSIYGLPSKERYTVIVKDDWICPEEYSDYDKDIFEIYTLTTFFDFVLKGKLIGWECSCLNKKYVIKEHVKLMMVTDPIQLRRDVDAFRKAILQTEGLQTTDSMYELIRMIYFSIQIIQNHKIVNYKEGKEDYSTLENSETFNEMWHITNNIYETLKSLTDGIIKQNILKKANKCKNTE